MDKRESAKYELISNICVNSKWVASFLCEDDEGYCECGMCKVKVKYIPNNYVYIMSKDEYMKAIAEHEQEEKPEYKICEWKCCEELIYETSCGEMFELMTDTPKANGLKFCPYCGGELKEID